jgi:hypothetical protein
MKNLDKLKKEFNRIKKMGFVECTRPNNTDGGIGNTFEDLLRALLGQIKIEAAWEVLPSMQDVFIDLVQVKKEVNNA